MMMMMKKRWQLVFNGAGFGMAIEGGILPVVVTAKSRHRHPSDVSAGTEQPTTARKKRCHSRHIHHLYHYYILVCVLKYNSIMPSSTSNSDAPAFY